ncbi:protein arginine N-methyltransferase, partial [Hyaloraphidium curvatum]
SSASRASAHVQKLVQVELSWATHIGMEAVLLDVADFSIDVCRLVNQFLHSESQTQIWVRVSMDGEAAPTRWDNWNRVRNVLSTSKRLGVALELGAELPIPFFLRQWLAEPVRVVLIPTDLFTSNAKGYPVLSRSHQDFLRQLFRRSCNAALRVPDAVSIASVDVSDRLMYMRHLSRTARADEERDQILAVAYHDVLQAPLQPLARDLDSSTYQVFETDKVKYAMYLFASLPPSCPPPIDARARMIAVVGAGRGPLVQGALEACARAGVHAHVVAIEKNGNAVTQLRNRKRSAWGDFVTVVHADVRSLVDSWPKKFDLVVSELLGSFGDNELSPECLDAACRIMKDGGFCIPASYRAYIAPLSAPSLHAECSAFNDLVHLETPYVVQLRQAHVLARPKFLWEFRHPSSHPLEYASSNDRSAGVDFKVEYQTIVHGLAGFFDATLWPKIMLSTLPEAHTPNMFSWFPMVFPIRYPIDIASGATLGIHFWRLSDTRRVWYEWCAGVSGRWGTIHNCGGASWSMGL